MMFSLSFVGGSRSAEGGPNPLAVQIRQRSKSASGFGPGRSMSASGFGPGGPYPLGHRLSGFNELAGWPPLHQIAKDSISKNIFHAE